MRLDVQKVLIVGPEQSRDLFFEKAQEAGFVEFISTDGAGIEKPGEIKMLMEAIHILRRLPPVKIKKSFDSGDATFLAAHVVDTSEKLEKESEKVRYLEKEIARVEVFGDFSPRELGSIEEETGRKVHFFFSKHEESAPLFDAPDLIYIDRRYGLDYFISLSKEKPVYPHLIEMKIDRPLAELYSELAQSMRIADNLDAERQALAPALPFLRKGLVDALNQFHLVEAGSKASSELEGTLFSAEGWVPVSKIDQLEKLCDEVPCYMSRVAEEEGDQVPTYLENSGLSRSGEDLINIYDTPGATDRDPSNWVFYSFALFFSMIIGDAGYGLLLLAITLYLKHRFASKKGLAKRILRLSLFLSCGCIVWGILSASFFGLAFEPDSRFRKFSLIDFLIRKKAEYLITEKTPYYHHLLEEYPALTEANDPMKFLIGAQKETGGYAIYEMFFKDVMLEFVLFLGAIHIFLGLLRYADKNWANIGWMVAIVGGYLYFPHFIHATSIIYYLFHVPPEGGAQVGLYLLFGGIGLATLLALMQKKLAGIAEPMNVVQIFADIMSYLRIYALALAGIIMASTFNGIAAKAPFYLGIWVILAGHTINFVLAIIGGIIHGLRLNFIEWYHYSFEGGGKPFQPLARLELD